MDDAQRNSGPGAVLVISSHVVRGSVGNRAMVFALETLGIPVWSVPTVVLPWHPGQGKGTRIVAPDVQFATLCAELGASSHAGELAAVVTGYFADEAQVRATADLIATLRTRNPAIIHVCDPVIGDQGGLYVGSEIAKAVRETLFLSADLVTPNRFEMGWLSGAPCESNDDIVRAVRGLKLNRAVVTSAHSLMAGSTGALLVETDRAVLAEHRQIPNPPNGTGDLMTALCTAHLILGRDSRDMLMRSTQSVYEMVARTARRGADELTLETDRECLVRPAAMVQMKQLIVSPSGGRRA